MIICYDGTGVSKRAQIFGRVKAKTAGVTDGAHHVAETGGAYWLIDEIAFGQSEPHIAAEEFQVWRLKVTPDQTATLTCDDGNDRIILTKSINYTDFPLDEIGFYFTDNVIMLPNEY